MSTAAVEVMNELKTILEAAGLKVDMFRNRENAVQQEDCPMVVLDFGGLESMQRDNCGQWTHTATIHADCYAEILTGKPILDGCMEQVSKVAVTINQNYTLNDKVENTFPVSTSSVEDIGADIGTMNLQITSIFHTSESDWTTLLI